MLALVVRLYLASPATPISLPTPPSPSVLERSAVACYVRLSIHLTLNVELFTHPRARSHTHMFSVHQNCPESASSLSCRLFVRSYVT